MVFAPLETGGPAETSQGSSNNLQAEATNLRSGKSAGGPIGAFENFVDKIPTSLAAVAGLGAGGLAAAPGDIGMAGKILAAGMAVTYGGDLLAHATGLGNTRDRTGSILKDSAVLAAIGGGAAAERFTKFGIPSETSKYPAIREEFLQSIKSFTPEEQAQMKDALAVAEDGHLGQLRMAHTDAPGVREPFAIHPVRTALLLTKEAGVQDADTITAALLHDVVEDSGGKYTLADIQQRFGTNVASIVDKVTKPPGELSGGHLSPSQLQTYYDGIEAAPQAVRDVKLADRLDNIRDTFTLNDRAFQTRYLNETVDHYLPIAQNTRPYFVDQLTASTNRLSTLLG